MCGDGEGEARGTEGPRKGFFAPRAEMGVSSGGTMEWGSLERSSSPDFCPRTGEHSFLSQA